MTHNLSLGRLWVTKTSIHLLQTDVNNYMKRVRRSKYIRLM